MLTSRSVYQIRQAEIFAALGCIIMGLWVIAPWSSMATPAYDSLLMMASEFSWGLIFLLNGVIHALALYINGSRWWTPFFRIFACVGALTLYACFTTGFYLSSRHTTAIPAYLVWGVLMSASCTYRAYLDAVTGSRRRYHGIA